MPVSPSVVIYQYRALPVALDDGTRFTVDVHNYACEWYGGGQTERHHYRDRLYHACHGDLLGLQDWEFVHVFTGGGSARAISTCLRLAARHRVYFHTGPPEGPGTGLTGMAGCRRVVEEYIGLDCTGFVGNWADMSGLPSPSVTRPPLDWVTHGRLVTRLPEVGPYNILIWCDGSHIAVLSAVEAYRPPRVSGDSLLLSRTRTESRKAVLCESAVDGLQKGQITIKFGESRTVVAHRHTRGGRIADADQTTRFRIDSPHHGEDIPVHVLHPNGT